MSKRPRPPDDLPASNGQPGPAAASRPPANDRPDAAPPLSAVLASRVSTRLTAFDTVALDSASRWAVILKRFRDYMHQR